MRITPFIVLTLAGISGEARACNCGGKQSGPMNLEPGQAWKLLVSGAQEQDFRDIGANGQLSSNGGQETKQTINIGLARALTRQVSLSLIWPVERKNHADEKSDVGSGDPSLGGRWTILRPSGSLWIPRLQFIAGYQHPLAKSSYDESRSPRGLDIHGAGFHEFMPGFDLWWGQERYKWGLTQTAIWSKEKAFQDVTVKPGLGWKTSLVAGYGFLFDRLRFFMSLDRESMGESTIDGQKIQDSDRLTYSETLSTEYILSTTGTLDAAIKTSGRFLTNKNTSRSDSFMVSYSHTIGETAQEPTTTQSVSAASDRNVARAEKMSAILNNYLIIQRSLSHDSTRGISRAAGQIMQLARESAGTSSEKRVSNEINKAAKSIREAKGLSQIRGPFKQLSSLLVPWVKREKPQGIFVAYCSMADANWLQSSKTIENPYYGKSMGSCGEILEDS